MPPNRFVKDVDTADFVADVIDRSKQLPVVVDFWAEWCEPCKQLSPLLERVVEEYGGAFELVKVDVDANQQLAGQMRVQSIPTVVAFVNGQPISQFSGAIPENQFRQWLDGFVQPPPDDRMVEIERLLEVGADQAAETKLSALIAEEPANKEAVLMLAALRIDDGRIEEATSLLDTLPPSTEVDRLRAAASLSTAGGDVTEIRARLEADPTNGSIRVELGRALAGVGDFEPALAELLMVVEDKGESADAARELMVDIFSLLGSEHPIVGTWRRRLASALY